MEFATSESFKTQMEFSACLNLHGYMFQKELQELQTCYDCYFYIVLMKKLYRSEGKLNQGRSTGVNWSGTQEHKRAVFMSDENSYRRNTVQNNCRRLFIAVPSGHGDCFWKHGILFANRTL